MHARGRYLLMVDADGATDIRDLEKLEVRLELDARAHGFGAALGSRAHLEDAAVAQVRRFLLRLGFDHVLFICDCVCMCFGPLTTIE